MDLCSRRCSLLGFEAAFVSGIGSPLVVSESFRRHDRTAADLDTLLWLSLGTELDYFRQEDSHALLCSAPGLMAPIDWGIRDRFPFASLEWSDELRRAGALCRPGQRYSSREGQIRAREVYQHALSLSVASRAAADWRLLTSALTFDFGGQVVEAGLDGVASLPFSLLRYMVSTVSFLEQIGAREPVEYPGTNLVVDLGLLLCWRLNVNDDIVRERFLSMCRQLFDTVHGQDGLEGALGTVARSRLSTELERLVSRWEHFLSGLRSPVFA
jgi:hypothetical protein